MFELREAILEWLAREGHENETYEAKAKLLGLSTGATYNLLGNEDRKRSISLDKAYPILRMMGYDIVKTQPSGATREAKQEIVSESAPIPVFGIVTFDDRVTGVKTTRKFPQISQEMAESFFSEASAWGLTTGPCRAVVPDRRWREFTSGSVLVGRTPIEKQLLPTKHYVVVTITGFSEPTEDALSSSRRQPFEEKSRSRKNQYLLWYVGLDEFSGDERKFALLKGYHRAYKIPFDAIQVEQIIVGAIARRNSSFETVSLVTPE